MRRLMFAALLALLVSTGSGCLIPAYSSDPARRTKQMIFTSENMRNILNEWERFWFLDAPDHATTQRVSGTVVN